MNIYKIIGGIFMISGTAIGGGMLALPLVSASIGFFGAAVLLCVTWGLMALTGLLVLEVNLALPAYHNSFSSMARATLGVSGQVITWFGILFLLYSLTGAYISGSASILSLELTRWFHWTLPVAVYPVGFTLVFGSIVWLGTRAVDLSNRWVMAVKLTLFVVVLAGLLPNVQWVHVISGLSSSSSGLLLMVPVALTSFGYQHLIPTLRNYFGDDPKPIRRVIIFGSFLPLIVYLLWLVATLGTIGPHGDNSLDFIRQSTDNLAALIVVLTHITQYHGAKLLINLFANIAVITSFFGVTLGLFDFLADGTGQTNTRRGRLKTALLTFIPPLLFTFIYPHAFVLALSVAAVFVTLLEVILPAWMVLRVRASTSLTSSYQVWGRRGLLYIIMFIGFLLLIMELLVDIHFIH